MHDQIRFPGEVPAGKLPEIMRSLSLVVQLPRYEGYGMVPLEAMASGVPFVGSQTGFYSDFSAQGQTGRVVPLEDVESALGAIRSILTAPDQLESMGRSARLLVEQSFSARNEADGIGQVYQALWADQT